MIREIIEFTSQLDPAFKQIGLRPRKGLYLILRFQEQDETVLRISSTCQWRRYSKKDAEMDTLLQQCAAWTKAAWMVDTFKCLDTPDKAIHSASPFCLAFKRNALEGGTTYQRIEKVIEGGKPKKQIYERIDAYFEKAMEFLEGEKEKVQAKAFCEVLNTKEKMHQWLKGTGERDGLKDDDYIYFFLDLPLSAYEESHNRYLREKLFNTKYHNEEDDSGEVWGTSNFFNSYNNKKPFLLHQSATFDISGRITAADACSLHEFSDLLGRNIFPRPLPIFIHKSELLYQKVFSIFKRNALLDPTQRKSYAEVFHELYDNHGEDLGNFYLLYYANGAIKDFDFVAKFRFLLRDVDSKPWKVKQLMKQGKEWDINNVFDFQNSILPIIFNNSLVVQRKKGLILHYFDDLKQKTCDDNNAVIYGLVLKYRKAIYDFIYKSKQATIGPHVVKDIMLSGILSDIKRDHKCDNTAKICNKLNIWFSLNHHFDPNHSNFNEIDMSSSIPRLLDKMRQVANDEAYFTTPEEFAFGAGQVIYFLLCQNQSEQKTHALLEPFTQKTDLTLLKVEISRSFDRYKHKISFTKGRFEKLIREVLGFEGPINLQQLFPVLLAGYFSDPVIFESNSKNI